ncbi:TetR/AcrR family transcriptional regulator [Actinomycetospora sp. TBRC 11914]|uniref:TetR/AcrR family transcriptional regulator n=1 Tax=Actinomycetospora sp. TBRC 11914 TaxID=2729387 RepID=UPI00145CCEE0|nr:TetR/AcrR family transcriptional regulator [Actinomycetospora sp. TBRC 11914]NMO90315.1 TetR/AcrR family transcriptional regulator [Actinomycetospora sp. TBRC 11914]
MLSADERERPTQAQRRERTEAALLHAAAELVVERGVRALTLAAVGTRAGYSRGIVSHHYGSKQALVDALARASQTGFVPGVVHPAGLQRLVFLIEGYVAALPGADTLSRSFLLLWAEAATSHELAEVFRERDEAFRAELRADVVGGIDAGDIRTDVDPVVTAVAIVGQLRGVGLQLLLAEDTLDPTVLAPEMAEQWRRALRVDARS